MPFKNIFLYLAKLLIGGVSFSAGTAIGGLVAGLLRLTPPTMPAGFDMGNAARNLMLSTPLIALALAIVAGGLGGRWTTRGFVLAFFTWIAYTVNTQLEASIFSSFATGIPFALVTYAVPSLLCGLAIAWMFPGADDHKSFANATLEYFSRRTRLQWTWRLALAAISFMPVYWLFGMLVVPFTAEYYRQNFFGLQMPALDALIPILFIRSVLFLVACFPILILWQKSARSLFVTLGFALFVLVGLVYMIASDWMPVSVRLPHTIEIMADEFVYAGALVLLLKKRDLSR